MTVAPAPSDAALVARLRSRDRTAWEDVYQLYGDRLYKFAYHLAGNPHDAADLVQETFVRVLPKLESLDPDTLDLGAYLFATERNLFLKSIELAKRQQPVDEIPEPTGPRPLEDDPQRSTLLVDQQERVRRANAALAPRQRLVLALRELEDRSYAEIGELVGLKENAVAQLISRARLRLREELRLVEVDRSKLPEECQALLPLLSTYLDGQLKGVAAERTIAHIESCEYCQKALTEMREASKLYRALIPIPFPELFERIDDALASNGFWDPTSAAFRGFARSKAAWLAAGGVAAIIAFVVLAGALLPTDDAEPAAAHGDTTPPQLVLPAETVRREATSPSGAPVAYTVSGEDETSGSVEVSCSPEVGDVFPLGETDVACSAQDEAGNTAEGSFAVEVVDTAAPVVTTPASIQIEAQGPEGATVAYRAQARDRVDTSLAIRCSPARGARWKPFQITSTEVFPLGKTTVECTARDGAGNVARKSFAVTVSDSKAPVLALPDALSVEAGAPVAYKATARDAVDGGVAVECSVPAGRKLPVGQTNVACTSTDAAGNIARASFVVRVGDTTAPILRLPDDLTVEASGRRTRVAFQTSVGGAGGVQCRPASRSLFPLGPTTVRCSASDAQGNTARGSFLVRVVDTTAPRAVVPQPLTVEATGPTGAKVEFAASAKDLADRRPRVTCSPASGSTFPLGTTTVRCTARDASGNRAAATFTATVVDTTAPSLTLPADRTLQATSTKGATVTYAASATDAVDGPLTPTCAPASGAVFPVGSTTVTCTARDAHGNERSGSFTVTITPFPQPDLVVSSVSGTSFTISNRGDAAAGLFRVTVQGVGTFTIRGLAAGASVTRTLTCASIQRTITVDSQNQVAESNETNNTARIPPC